MSVADDIAEIKGLVRGLHEAFVEHRVRSERQLAAIQEHQSGTDSDMREVKGAIGVLQKRGFIAGTIVTVAIGMGIAILEALR